MKLRNLLSTIKERYKRLAYRYKLNSFYLYNGQAPSVLARLFNLIFAETLVFLLSYIWFLNRLNRPLTALALSIVLTLLLNISYWLQKKKRLANKRRTKRKELARDCLLDILIRQSPDEFKWQILRLVLKIPGAGSIKAKGGFLETTIKGRKMAIGYYNDRFADDISPQFLSAFLVKIKDAGYDEAIYLTSGVYSDKCKSYAKKKRRVRLHLLDKHKLLDIMEGLGMVPDDKVIDSLVKKKLEDSRQDYTRLRKEILAPRRRRSYLGYAFFFAIASIIINVFKLYYMIFSLIFFSLALISWFNSRTKPDVAESRGEVIDLLISDNTQKDNWQSV
ncbi:MAG TPA: hypothetical protein VFD33_01065 [Bacillota bacterium]|nr:hypothetical protein [Bacillota bacterium]